MSATINQWRYKLAELSDILDTLQTIPYNPSLDALLECALDQCTAFISTLERIIETGQRLAQNQPQPQSPNEPRTLH